MMYLGGICSQEFVRGYHDDPKSTIKMGTALKFLWSQSRSHDTNLQVKGTLYKTNGLNGG